MKSTDILNDALSHALKQIGGATGSVAVINATGAEDASYTKQSHDACRHLNATLDGTFDTVLVRATRQTEETLGLIAQAVTHAAPGARILVAQENAHGAGALEKQMHKAWDEPQSVIKFKCRAMVVDADAGDKAVLDRWAQRASMQKVKHNRGEFWSAPGVFSWDRPDPGSRLLLDLLPASMPGRIADLGCGNGLLTCAVAKKADVTEVYAMDADARAVEACRKNLADRAPAMTAQVMWRDATEDLNDLPRMDYVVMNPPFHTQQEEMRELGQKFCNAALELLQPGGFLYLVANRHMPYEDILKSRAKVLSLLADTDGYKVLRAQA